MNLCWSATGLLALGVIVAYFLEGRLDNVSAMLFMFGGLLFIWNILCHAGHYVIRGNWTGNKKNDNEL